ncbi:MAG TPA: DUF3135 domain-containing protein [Chromatiaceae bacterium]|nr:DUF3135 domain-containing protein [Chromatiaceae bacterium]HIA08992.1 DUF3135 domain-containing protein [Chromatiaceae bacterium]
MTDITRTGFDFDEWAKLAESDPKAFEKRREVLISATIDQAPEARRQRLRGLQWRVDQVRRRASTPLGACVQISEMLWDSVTGPDGLVNALDRLGRVVGGDDLDIKPVVTAKVLSLEPLMDGSSDTRSAQGQTQPS